MKRVKDFMSDKVVSISAHDTLKVADDIITLGNIRHLPVVKGGVLVGIVSQRDLLRASLSSILTHREGERDLFLERIPVADVMTAKVITVGPETDMKSAVRLLLAHKIGCLPVVGREGELLGLLTETDVFRCFLDGCS